MKVLRLERVLIGNSNQKTLRAAAGEWRLDDIPVPLKKYVSCECCGTAIKRTVRIVNGTTGTTLVVGTVCYDNLLRVLEGKHIVSDLSSRQAFVRERRERAVTAHEQRYRDYFPGIDLYSWTQWLKQALSQESDKSESLCRALSEIETHGEVQSEALLPILWTFHDERRYFPAEVLLPSELTKGPDPPSPAITISEARRLLQRASAIREAKAQTRMVLSVEEDSATRARGMRAARRRDGLLRRTARETLLELRRYVMADYSIQSASAFRQASSRLYGRPGIAGLMIDLHADRILWQTKRTVLPGDVVWGLSNSALC